MKKIISNKNYWTSLAFIGAILVSIFFTACDDDNSLGGEITISKIYLEDVNSSVPDRVVTFVRLGQLLRIEGSGFTGLRKVYINGLSTYFNPVYLSDTSMLISVFEDTPIVEAEESVRNTIRFVNDNYETIYNFDVRSGAPYINNISNTLPLPGETITVYGGALIEVNKVVFPGNIEVTSEITSDVDGEYFTVVVPNGVSDTGGSLFIECSNGGAYSPAYFNFKNGIILDFDGIGSHGYWGAEDASMIHPNDLESTSIGTEHISQGIYVAHRPSRIASFDAGSNRNSEVWTGGSDWRSRFTPFISAETPIEEVALQFDIYVPNAWEASGFLKICLINNFNGGEWAGGAYNYVPWIVDGEMESFQTTGWRTVTVPLNKFYEFSDTDSEYTFEDVLVYREAATYPNFGFFFENSDIKLADVDGSNSEVEFPSTITSADVYTDNWRIVSLETPTYSDFSE